jgi:hypothetical protein
MSSDLPFPGLLLLLSLLQWVNTYTFFRRVHWPVHVIHPLLPYMHSWSTPTSTSYFLIESQRKRVENGVN